MSGSIGVMQTFPAFPAIRTADALAAAAARLRSLIGTTTSEAATVETAAIAPRATGADAAAPEGGQTNDAAGGWEGFAFAAMTTADSFVFTAAAFDAPAAAVGAGQVMVFADAAGTAPASTLHAGLFDSFAAADFAHDAVAPGEAPADLFHHVPAGDYFFV